jgi:tetrahydromethanopterin S-methyltransferase subunit B
VTATSGRKLEQLQAALRSLDTYEAATVEFRPGQGYFARAGYRTHYFQTFVIGMRFVEQLRTTGRAQFSDLRIR